MQSKLRITPAPSNLTKYAQKTLCTKTPLSRGVTGKTFTDTEKNTKKKKTGLYPFSDWDCHRQPSNNREVKCNNAVLSNVHTLRAFRSCCQLVGSQGGLVVINRASHLCDSGSTLASGRKWVEFQSISI